MAQKVFPQIYQAKYGELTNQEFTKQDARLNSGILRLISRLTRPQYDDGFYLDSKFRIRIEDQHDSEAEPHYILDVGYGCDDLIADEWMYSKSVTNLSARYCDNWSSPDAKIIQTLGEVKIYVCTEGDLDYSASCIAKFVLREYIDLLAEIFSEYFIVFDESALS